MGLTVVYLFVRYVTAPTMHIHNVDWLTWNATPSIVCTAQDTWKRDGIQSGNWKILCALYMFQ